ncbi:contact-dependent growth inhibition system immunity protein [Streptomyces sp. NPDC047130]|uniref:contact-dependent growth inhibition system immunity protein n=1 Tax=Streptomyces sp. NPDC047130 TaxID=3155261 RepID=UPI0033D10817
MTLVADFIRSSVMEGDVPPPATPATHWEWNARYPELGRFLAGWFSQGMPDEFDDHDAAVDDYRTATHPHLVTVLVGELHELLALGLDEPASALALAELGMEVDPPVTCGSGGWLALVAERLVTK